MTGHPPVYSGCQCPFSLYRTADTEWEQSAVDLWNASTGLARASCVAVRGHTQTIRS